MFPKMFSAPLEVHSTTPWNNGLLGSAPGPGGLAFAYGRLDVGVHEK